MAMPALISSFTTCLPSHHLPSTGSPQSHTLQKGELAFKWPTNAKIIAATKNALSEREKREEKSNRQGQGSGKGAASAGVC